MTLISNVIYSMMMFVRYEQRWLYGGSNHACFSRNNTELRSDSRWR